MSTPTEPWWRRLSPPLVAILVFTAAGLLEAVHGYIGYRISGRPEFGYTLRGQQLSFPAVFVRSLPSWISLGLLAALALRLARRRPLFATTWRRSLAFHLPLAIVFAASFLVMAGTFRHVLFIGPEVGVSYGTTLLRYYTVYFNTTFLFYWGIVGLYSGFVHYRHLRERDLQAEKLQRKLTEARLRALQQQLEPHFLFNTLNAISGLAQDGDVQGVVRTLTLLGDLLRETLRRDEQVVTVADELRLLTLYLDIQRIRLEERLDVRMNVDAAVLDAEIPAFLLQPLVENAIRHGITRESRPGRIEIGMARRGRHVHAVITDTGPGIDFHGMTPGIGIGNCAARLEQLYGEDGLLRLSNGADGGGRVEIEWPYRQRGSAPESANDTVTTDDEQNTHRNDGTAPRERAVVRI